ncbi:set1/Ash2 histone methyltransferase complex subunit ASH2-like [Amphiura filiformis]|uniref:set1/Ash2 histone methyltransferase complex subunit ASH2-like n=1 Tax=Amphiura filiformis TaxID=82378 RepID=UPI003B2173CD
MADDNKDSDVNTETSETPMETSAEETEENQDVEMDERTSASEITAKSSGSAGDTGATTGSRANVAAVQGGSTVTALGKSSGLCYCGRGRSVGEVELQCSVCMQWFHKECITTTNVGNMLPFMTTYHFCCKYCHPNNQEVYSRRMPNFSQLCHMALANLMSQHRNDSPPKTMFSKDKELIPFIHGNWESLTPMQRRTTVTWHATIVKAMLKDSELFVQKEKPDDPSEDESDYPMFGLVDKDLSNISPNYDPSKPSGNVSVTTAQTLASSNNGNSTTSLPPVSRGKRGPKKRERDIESAIAVSTSKKSKGDVIITPKLPPHGFPMEHPYNKDGYRYVLTETDPQVQSAAYDDDFWIGKPIPAHLYRAVVGTVVLLAPQDRAPQVKIADNRLTATGEKGYCMVRATHGTNRGAWYFEVKVDSLPAGAATRIGWSQPLGNLQAPLGYDKFSYSWRSRKGTRFHQSRGKHYSDAYNEGDVLGFYIKLPDTAEPHKLLPETYKDSTLIKFKSHLYFEEKDEAAAGEKSLKPTEKTKIIFFKNGVSQGVAFEDIFEGTYLPAISLFKGSTVTANFGPAFKHPPKDVTDWQPVCSLAQRAQVEQTLADIIYHIEHEDEYRNYEMGVYA